MELISRAPISENSVSEISIESLTQIGIIGIV
jgi:hypothetical protein